MARTVGSSPTRITWSSGLRARVVERPEDDLGRTVIAAHRVDRDADPGALGAGGPGLGLGHRVSARRRRPAVRCLGGTARRPW